MSYIVVKNKHHGCYALKTKYGDDLVQIKNKLENSASKGVEIMLISRPEAFGEYAPYTFVESLEELIVFAANA